MGPFLAPIVRAIFLLADIIPMPHNPTFSWYLTWLGNYNFMRQTDYTGRSILVISGSKKSACRFSAKNIPIYFKLTLRVLNDIGYLPLLTILSITMVSAHYRFWPEVSTPNIVLEAISPWKIFVRVFHVRLAAEWIFSEPNWLTVLMCRVDYIHHCGVQACRVIWPINLTH